MNICIADKLYESVAARGPICVGLDTDISYVPQWLAAQYQTPGEAVFAFNRQSHRPSPVHCLRLPDSFRRPEPCQDGRRRRRQLRQQ